ncbi:MAG: hypothetical protein NTZ35_02870 [Ignavibacteriales bacterium]|nr:hypothetical protein [Ignavibacteriales bacterium]
MPIKKPTVKKPTKKNTKKPVKRPVGRPKIDIDMNLVDSLCKIQCTGVEIAAILGIAYDSLNNKINEYFAMNFSEYIKEKANGGRASLRRMQWKAAEEGNCTMQIWLGKNYLGQSDKVETENHTVVDADGFEKALSESAKAIWPIHYTQKQLNKVSQNTGETPEGIGDIAQNDNKNEENG